MIRSGMKLPSQRVKRRQVRTAKVVAREGRDRARSEARERFETGLTERGIENSQFVRRPRQTGSAKIAADRRRADESNKERFKQQIDRRGPNRGKKD